MRTLIVIILSVIPFSTIFSREYSRDEMTGIYIYKTRSDHVELILYPNGYFQLEYLWPSRYSWVYDGKWHIEGANLVLVHRMLSDDEEVTWRLLSGVKVWEEPMRVPIHSKRKLFLGWNYKIRNTFVFHPSKSYSPTGRFHKTTYHVRWRKRFLSRI